MNTDFSASMRLLFLPMAGLEPAQLSSPDFESGVSAIPPHRHVIQLPNNYTTSFFICQPFRRRFRNVMVSLHYVTL